MTKLNFIQIYVLLIFIACENHEAYGFSRGAPDSDNDNICKLMKPIHGHEPQVTPSPFGIFLPKRFVAPGEVIQIRLAPRNNGTRTFAGFLVMARKRSFETDDTPKGKFVLPNSHTIFKAITCRELVNSSVTHSSPDPKRELTLDWKAPEEAGEYIFLATFVQSFETYWVQVPSDVLTVNETTSTRSSTAKPATDMKHPAAAMTYEECGKSVHCFGLPENCVGTKSCDVMALWLMNSKKVGEHEKSIHFKLVGNVTLNSSAEGDFVALGISEDSAVGNDTLVGCYVDRGKVVVQEFAHFEYWRQPLPWGSNQSLISQGRSSFETNGNQTRIECEFDIKETLYPTKDSYAVTEKSVNLSSDHVYLLLLRGHNADASTLGDHPDKVDMGTSKQAIRLGDVLAQSKSRTCSLPMSSHGEATAHKFSRFKSECGKSSGCLAFPDGCLESEDCVVFVKFNLFGAAGCQDLVEFELVGKPMSPNSGYIAVGISHDNKMGEDSVFGCYQDGDTVRVGEFYNVGTRNRPVDRGDSELLIVSDFGARDDKFMRCHFLTKSHIDLKKEIATSFNLSNESVFILIATGGRASLNGLGYHTNGTRVSSSRATKVSNSYFLSSKSSNILVGLHGGLMVFGWVLLVTIGQFTARYYKDVHPQAQLFGKAWWFVVHQCCMITAVSMTVVGVILIFLDVGGYTAAPTGDFAEVYHPILGLIVTCLAILQIFGAFCRPGPDDKHRYVFNWAHWIIGTASHWIAIACIFLANALAKTKLSPTFYCATLVAFVVVHLIMHMIISIHIFSEDNPQLVLRGVMVGPRSGAKNDEGKICSDDVKIRILLLEIIAVAIFSIALVVYIGKSV